MMEKMFVAPTDDVVVINDGVTILSEIEIEESDILELAQADLLDGADNDTEFVDVHPINDDG